MVRSRLLIFSELNVKLDFRFVALVIIKNISNSLTELTSVFIKTETCKTY